MNKEIQINLLPYNTNRISFTKKSLDFLCKIKDENKKKITVVIFADKNINEWNEISEDINKKGILSKVIQSSGYMPKIREAIKTECKYSCCMDEDVIMNQYVWDYLIENVNCLDNDKNLLLSPLLSNGIPTVEMFIESFFDEDEKNELYEIFNRTNIPNLWGVNYETLNFKSEFWDYNKFYNEVKKINHYYKGIHPIRISYEAHMKIAEFICNKKDKFLSKQNYKIKEVDLPYFCNNIYLIKTEVWSKIINDSSLFKDGFDEVPLNIYKEINNKNMVFVENSHAVHMAYNTLNIFKSNHQSMIERYYHKNFLNVL